MSFARDIKKWAEQTGQDINTVRRATFLDLTGRIIKRTPVDTGRAKGNWQPSSRTVLTTTINMDYPNAIKGSDGDLAGVTVMAKTRNVAAQVKNDDTLYLANNLPYIVPLEYGYSKQSPGGMLRITVQEFQIAVKTAVNSL